MVDGTRSIKPSSGGTRWGIANAQQQTFLSETANKNETNTQ
jgi:hypothetical protein